MDASSGKNEKLFLRFSTTADVDRVLAFYHDNPHSHVAHRDSKILEERIRSGAVTLVEDGQGQICGACIIYPIEKKDADGSKTHAWSEVGTTRVTKNGFGLFEIMITALMLRAHLLEPPDDRIVVEVDVANVASLKLFLRLGCETFDPVPEGLQEAADSTIDPADTGVPVNWLYMPPEKMPELARKFREFSAGVTLKNSRTGESVDLDCSRCVLTSLFAKQVAALAAQKSLDAGASSGLAQKPPQKNIG